MGKHRRGLRYAVFHGTGVNRIEAMYAWQDHLRACRERREKRKRAARRAASRSRA